MGLHYHTGCCGSEKQVSIKLSKTKEIHLDRLTNKYIRELFDEYDVTQDTRTKLWEFYYAEISKALKIGYNSKIAYYDRELAERLQKNIATFSAFKETSFKKTLHEILTDGNRLTSWSAFKKKAEKVAGDYNRKWLKTEYDHTIANANATAQWGKFQAQKTVYPNLKFNTVGDNAVRADHKKYHGFIAPVDDPIWKKLQPPLDWGCRCYITQTDEEPSDKQPDTGKVKDIFANNPAQSGEIFKDGMPYSSQLSKNEKIEAEILAKEQRLTPKKITEYEKQLKVTIDKSIFRCLKKETPLHFINPSGFARNSNGAYYMPGHNFVKIPIDQRRKLSKWYAESVIYHEYGHAYDFQTGFRTSKEVIELMRKHKKMIDFASVDKRLIKLVAYGLKKRNYNLLEKIGATRDTIKALNINYGAGHSNSYFLMNGKAEAEFIAHCFENYFAGNNVFKKVMPELYKDMAKLVEDVKTASSL